jgi:glutamate-1-semialdehyde aminotransferase
MEYDYDSLARDGMRLDASICTIPHLLSSNEERGHGAPSFAARAKGPYIWDLVGRQFLDLMLGFGSVVLGHAYDAVDEAVIAQLRNGVAPTLRAPTEIGLVRLLARHVPNAQMSLLLRTGSDATEAAVRIARAFTGRRFIFHWGYQGWHDWCAPRAAGIPESYRSYTKTFTFNNLESLEELFSLYRGDVACVIMMPMELEKPVGDFLSCCRELARSEGALFIFDDIRTGFRVAMGGAQEYFGVSADLVTMSKAMGNGYAISAVSGRREIMQAASDISVSSAFFRSADGIAAANATIGELESRHVPGRLWELGRHLVAGLDAAIARARLPARVIGLPVMPFHAFDLPAQLSNAAHKEFCRAAAAEGVLFHPSHHWFVCAAMSFADIDTAVEAAGAGYAAVRRLLADS